MSEIEGARADADGERYGILLVDDEPAILESLELTLVPEYRVFTASTGEQERIQRRWSTTADYPNYNNN